MPVCRYQSRSLIFVRWYKNIDTPSGCGQPLALGDFMLYRLVFCAFSYWCVASVAATTHARVEQTSTTEMTSDRMIKRAGAYLGVLGDPFPTLVGVNLGFNIFDFLRVHGGVGKISSSTSFGTSSVSASATTVGAGARLFVPGWNLSPTLGLGAAAVLYTSDGAAIRVQGFDASGAHVYGSFGLDWQTASGFNLGLGYNISFRSGIGGLPYLNLGWFTDLI